MLIIHKMKHVTALHTSSMVVHDPENVPADWPESSLKGILRLLLPLRQLVALILQWHGACHSFPE